VGLVICCYGVKCDARIMLHDEGYGGHENGTGSSSIFGVGFPASHDMQHGRDVVSLTSEKRDHPQHYVCTNVQGNMTEVNQDDIKKNITHIIQ